MSVEEFAIMRHPISDGCGADERLFIELAMENTFFVPEKRRASPYAFTLRAKQTTANPKKRCLVRKKKTSRKETVAGE
jgi:hypothetical protein